MTGVHAIVTALERAGVSLAPTVPDLWIGTLMDGLRRSAKVRVVDVAREEEAVAIACGAALCGARAAVIIQNAGLLNCGAVIGSLVQLYRIPCFFLISYRGDERDPTYYHVPKGRATIPTLDAWSMQWARAQGPAKIGGQIEQGLTWTDTACAPFALLFSAEDLA